MLLFCCFSKMKHELFEKSANIRYNFVVAFFFKLQEVDLFVVRRKMVDVFSLMVVLSLV